MTDLPLAIVCDLDGTLALLNGRDPYDASTCENDTVNEPVAHIVRTYADAGVAVILVSGRNVRHRAETKAWLHTHHIPHESLYMRRARDFRKDAVIKAEVFEARLRSVYQVLFVLEDRDQAVAMWRGLGLTCLQVAPGDF
jgi:hypothetical protein